MNYLKRLNWSGFFLTWLILILAAFTRKDETLFQSFMIGLIGGFIGGLLPLFVGMEDKKITEMDISVKILNTHLKAIKNILKDKEWAASGDEYDKNSRRRLRQEAKSISKAINILKLNHESDGKSLNHNS